MSFCLRPDYPELIALKTADFYPRYLRPRVMETLADSPVVLIHGPRQCGRTLKRQASWQEEPVSFSHFRDKDKVAVDFVLGYRGKLAGIEVKESSTVTLEDFKGLYKLQHPEGIKRIGYSFHPPSAKCGVKDGIIGDCFFQ